MASCAYQPTFNPCLVSLKPSSACVVNTLLVSCCCFCFLEFIDEPVFVHVRRDAITSQREANLKALSQPRTTLPTGSHYTHVYVYVQAQMAVPALMTLD